MVQTPVLFETFVRVDYARLVWEAIKVAQPKKLYFYSNKGRAEKEGEIERNNEIRSWVKEINWDCELHTWFREECVDVYTSLKGAISWLFENEETGIILEDDCLPSKAFFDYCDKMMTKYKYVSNVWFISGDNFLEDITPPNCDIFYSRHKWMYGWASWKDRWENINWSSDFIHEAVNSNIYDHIMPKRIHSFFYRHLILKYNLEKMVKHHCWDYVFGLNVDANGGVGLYPAKNLVKNIGEIGEHSTKREKMSMVYNRPTFEGDVYPTERVYPFIFPNKRYETKMFDAIFIKPNLSIKRVLRVTRKFVQHLLNT